MPSDLSAQIPIVKDLVRANGFEILQIASYLASGGRSLSDDPCLEDATCAWIPALPESP